MIQYVEVDSNNLAKSVRELSDLIFKMQKELDFKFSNLIVGENVRMGEGTFITWGDIAERPEIPDGYNDEMVLKAIEKTYIDSYGIFTPNMYATNLSVLKGKIQAAQIETLYVGQDVFMAPGSTISWLTEISNKPFIPDDYYITQITEDTIRTTNVVANNLFVNAANIAGTLSSVYIDVVSDVRVGNKLYLDGYSGMKTIDFGYDNKIMAGYYGAYFPTMYLYSGGNIELYPGPYGGSVMLPYSTYLGWGMEQVATEVWVKDWIAALGYTNFYDVRAEIGSAMNNHILRYH